MNGGILAVWNDRDEAIAALYEDWYINEHLPERVGVSGWRLGRRYEAVDAEPRFFTYYETASPAACFSTEYRARLDQPTPQTTEVMRHWSAMSRTVCEEVERRGRLTGAFVVAVRFADRAAAAGGNTFDALAGACLGARRWVASADPQTATSVEAAVRGTPDGHIDGAWVFDFLREAEARAFTSEVRRTSVAAAPAVGLYRFLCEYR